MISGILFSVGIGAFVALLTFVALQVTCWVIGKIIQGIASLIQKINEKIAVIRKRIALLRFLEGLRKEAEKITSKEEKKDILAAINDLKNDKDRTAILVPLNSSNEENWSKLRIIQAQQSESDNMADTTVVTADARYRSV